MAAWRFSGNAVIALLVRWLFGRGGYRLFLIACLGFIAITIAVYALQSAFSGGSPSP